VYAQYYDKLPNLEVRYNSYFDFLHVQLAVQLTVMFLPFATKGWTPLECMNSRGVW